MPDDIFQPSRDMLAYLKKTVVEEYQRAEPYIERCYAEGDEEGARARRQHLEQSLHHIRREIAHLVSHLPPFASEKDGVIYLHPVIPENGHIFREMTSAK